MLSDKESCHLHFYLSACVCVTVISPEGVCVCVCGLSHCNNYNLSANCRRYWLNHITYRLYSAYIFANLRVAIEFTLVSIRLI